MVQASPPDVLQCDQPQQGGKQQIIVPGLWSTEEAAKEQWCAMKRGIRRTQEKARTLSQLTRALNRA